MPSLGADMDEGTLVEWLVAPGDRVHRGEVVAVVDTAKSAIEVEVFQDGVVEELLVRPGTTVPVGAPLARLTDGAAETAEGTPASPPATEAPPAEAALGGPVVTSPIIRHLAHEQGVELADVRGTGPQGSITRADVEARAATRSTGRVVQGAVRPASSPLARRRAAELGVDLAGVRGSGPDGAVTVADVEAATGAAPAGAGPAAGAVPVTRASAATKALAMREAIGALMARSKREIPHYYLSTTVDLSAALARLRSDNATRSVSERVLPAALLLKATAVAVRSVPEVNGFYVDGAFRPSAGVHLGVAIALRGGGLVAPAIHDADTLTLEELMAALKDLVARARAGRLRGSEMADPTITVTNLGDQGVEAVHGVIYPPQVALVGFGKVVERPWAVDGLLGVRPLLTATLAADHRVTDGHRGGLFLAAVEALLQRPEEL